MTITGIIFGHDAFYTGGHWCWKDTGEPVEPVIKRLCPECGLLPTTEGYDPCIGHIQGAASVCCGHGRERGYVAWEKYVVWEGPHERRSRSDTDAGRPISQGH